ESTKELENNSIHLVVTSPPYFNTPFDYPDLFESYNANLDKMGKVARELKRVVAEGRIVCIVCDDTLIKSKKPKISSKKCQGDGKKVCLRKINVSLS
ncbi:MAG: DNA methyltransferase, partial [Brevinematia bacterium]